MSNETRTAKEILSGATEVNGTELRCQRHNLLNGLKIRLEEFLSVFNKRGNKGPSLKEMVLIVEDIEGRLEYIKKYDRE